MTNRVDDELRTCLLTFRSTINYYEDTTSNFGHLHSALSNSGRTKALNTDYPRKRCRGDTAHRRYNTMPHIYIL